MFFTTILTAITGSKLFKSLGKWVIILLLVVGFVGILWYGASKVVSMVEQVTLANKAVEDLKLEAKDLKGNFETYQKSTDIRLESMLKFQKAIEKVDADAKARNASTNLKIITIQADKTLTVEQKDEQISNVYIVTLRQAFCTYNPTQCQVK